MAKRSIMVALVAALISPLSAFAQGSVGTGSTSTSMADMRRTPEIPHSPWLS